MDSARYELFATNRVPGESGGALYYSNSFGRDIHLGKVTVHLGSPDSNWDELYAHSLGRHVDGKFPVNLLSVSEHAILESDNFRPEQDLTFGQTVFFEAINRELAQAADKEIMVSWYEG